MAKFDITSLYPYVNYVSDYPIGHPIDVDFNKPVCWTSPEDVDKVGRGVFKVFQVPPHRGIVNGQKILPVLPYRINDVEVLFINCKECAHKNYGKNYVTDKEMEELEKCNHTDEERGWITEVFSEELKLALTKGYKVTHLHSALLWDEFSDELFKCKIYYT